MKTIELDVGQTARLYFAVKDGEAPAPFDNPTDYWVEVEQDDKDEVSTYPVPIAPDAERDDEGRPKEGLSRSTGWCPVNVTGKRPGTAQVRVTFREANTGVVREEAANVLVHSADVLTAVRISG
jgi:hypothetical protein